MFSCSADICSIFCGLHWRPREPPETEGTGNTSTVAADRTQLDQVGKARASTSTSLRFSPDRPVPNEFFSWATLARLSSSNAPCLSPFRHASHPLDSSSACCPSNTNLLGLSSHGMVWSNCRRPSLALGACVEHARRCTDGPSQLPQAHGDPAGPSMHGLHAKSKSTSSKGNVEPAYKTLTAC